MYIAPNTIIKILKNVPLDNTYNHTIKFSSLTAQQNYFNSTGVVKYVLNNESYQRVNRNKMRIEIQSEYLYDCNYLAFQNTAFGNKWFYAFITSVEYVNNVTSEITYEIDSFQTYLFDITVGECFVEREHVTDDSIGANTMAEPVDCPDCDVISTRDIIFNRWRIAINFCPSIINLIACAIYEWTENVNNVISQKIAEATNTFQEGILKVIQALNGALMTTAHAFYPNNMGAIREHQFTGLAPYITDTFIQEGTGGNVNKILSDVKRVLDTMNATGGTVTSVYQVPEELITGFSDSAYFDIESSWFEPLDRYFYINTRQQEYYIPKNNKLFTSPYTYLKVINKQGGEMNLAYEKIQDKKFRFWGCWQNGEVSCFMANEKYGTKGTMQGESENLCRLPITNFPTCNYNTNGLVSRLTNTLGVLGRNIMPHYSTANIQDSTVSSSKSRIQNREGRKVVSSTTITNEGETHRSYKKPLVDSYISELGALANSVIGNVGHVDNTPSSSSCDIAKDTFGYALEVMQITGEYAQVIDNFFEHFGYAVKRNKVPNMSTRPHWNYVKCSDCYITGNCPADDLEVIISCFNNGITFWKNPSEVGNYSLNNH